MLRCAAELDFSRCSVEKSGNVNPAREGHIQLDINP